MLDELTKRANERETRRIERTRAMWKDFVSTLNTANGKDEISLLWFHTGAIPEAEFIYRGHPYLFPEAIAKSLLEFIDNNSDGG